MLSRRLYLLVLALLAAVPALAAEPPIRVEHGWARATPDNATIGALIPCSGCSLARFSRASFLAAAV